MAIQVSWMDESKTVLVARYAGEWTMGDYFRFVEEREALIMAQAHKVHIVYDYSDSTSTPKDLLAGAQYANKHMPNNQGIVVLLKANPVIKAFMLMAKRTGLPVTRYVYTAESKEEALSLIEKKAHRVS
jgi:hypothetical protein